MIKLRFNANIMFSSQKKYTHKIKRKYGCKALKILPCRIFLFRMVKRKGGSTDVLFDIKNQNCGRVDQRIWNSKR